MLSLYTILEARIVKFPRFPHAHLREEWGNRGAFPPNRLNFIRAVLEQDFIGSRQQCGEIHAGKSNSHHHNFPQTQVAPTAEVLQINHVVSEAKTSFGYFDDPRRGDLAPLRLPCVVILVTGDISEQPRSIEIQEELLDPRMLSWVQLPPFGSIALVLGCAMRLGKFYLVDTNELKANPLSLIIPPHYNSVGVIFFLLTHGFSSQFEFSQESMRLMTYSRKSCSCFWFSCWQERCVVTESLSDGGVDPPFCRSPFL